MSNLTIKPFAKIETIGNMIYPLTMIAQFQNNTNKTITISKVQVSVQNHFMFFSKEYDCNFPNFNVVKNYDLELDLSFLAKIYNDKKKFTIIAEDTNGNTYESEWSALSLYRRN